MKNRIVSFFCASTMLFFFCCENVSAQKNIPLIDSYDLLQKGIAFADSGQYDKASALYEQISRNDTNYTLAVYEEAVSRISGGEDSIAIGLCRKGIGLNTEYTPDFYKFLSNAYIDLNKDNNAIKLLSDTAIPKYPNVYLLEYSLGLAYYKSHQYDSAVVCFERAIKLNIFHASSHYYLGRCCLEQGRMIPALLSLQFFLILEPTSSRALSAVQVMEQVSKGNYEYNKATVVDPQKYNDDAFSELDLDIKSKIALSDNYPAKTKVAFDIMKQCQLFVEKITYTPNTNNFWMETYVPFFVELQKKEFFEPYIYFIMGSVGDDALQKERTKDKKKIDEFTTWAGKNLAEKRDKKEITTGGGKKTLTNIYYDNQVLEAQGEENAKGKTIGDWTIYNQYTGTIEAKGAFNENANREGQWIWYYYDGTMKERTNYKDGKRDGVSEAWYKNGAPKDKYTYTNDKLNGEVSEYNSSGILSSHGTYVNDKPIGQYTLYYDDGKQHYIVNYSDAGLDGDQKEYYLNGQLSLVSTYKNGKKNGTLTDYWENGKTEDQGQYKDDNQFDAWKYYYKDGSLKKEGAYSKDGKTIDQWTSYYRNGKKEEEMNYNKAVELDGQDILYDVDGLKYSEFEYRNGTLQQLTCIDKSGKTLYTSKIASGILQHQNFYPNGIKINEGESVNGLRNGKWKFYSVTGALSDEENYNKGLLEGMRTEYYDNGQVKDSLMYVADMAIGLYHGYYLNGQLKSMGWYSFGQKTGDWYYYNAHGTITSHFYYQNNAISGYADYYDVNGKLSTEEYHNNLGYFDKAWVYDTNGSKIIYTYISDKGNGSFKDTYNNGQSKIDRTYVSGNIDGHQKMYFYDGKIKSESDYLSDNLQGKQTDYYDNGAIESVSNYIIGVLDGPAVKYYPNGKEMSEENYFDDNEDGPYKEYYESGHLRRKGQYSDGGLEGEKRSYSEDSALYCISWYHNGVITGYAYLGKDGNMIAPISMEQGTGNMTCYYSNGTKSIECTYSHGAFNGKRVVYTPAAKPFEDENYLMGNLNGQQKYYYSNGNIKAEETYYLGDKDGVCNYYYDNGKPESEEHWVTGSRHGLCKYYDKEGKLKKTVLYYNDEIVSVK